MVHGASLNDHVEMHAIPTRGNEHDSNHPIVSHHLYLRNKSILDIFFPQAEAMRFQRAGSYRTIVEVAIFAHHKMLTLHKWVPILLSIEALRQCRKCPPGTVVHSPINGGNG
jgi:hypothetical protein